MCNLGWDVGTCSHRQRLRDRIQFDGAAVPVSWFVEEEKCVFLLRTGTMMILRVVVSSCLFLLWKDFRSGVSVTLEHTRPRPST